MAGKNQPFSGAAPARLGQDAGVAENVFTQVDAVFHHDLLQLIWLDVKVVFINVEPLECYIHLVLSGLDHPHGIGEAGGFSWWKACCLTFV
jgi:hypothetical protein